ncbi:MULTISPECIES: transcription termination/antitermination protein NusG [Wolbachia]|uniref:Transcription termination/antitermination protein NusG n=1 Tax=Wolbachia pipientis TaxID=955 RepID=A0A6I6CT74_WOLPI|nr:MULTISPECIES: transcription termination/antitermination protein NusG [Wolbachia]MDE5059448.1 transcription termination/antitermination protein NusG [Wolbachia endosymbiont of Drosophila burlai]MDU8941601.1 transcription termination/antitermination protein NusG [Wolbachia endosymbiont of Drosophila malagassya]MDX5496102.1 transcription termination/antitermination protein NusG [Wolbachia endosymbiont of Nomada fabriciana]MDX5526451.1 transcription termination/antitermination protein NusG [Wolb
MECEYKWYIIKVDYGYEQNIRELVSNAVYFKEVFIPYQTVCNSKSDIKELCEVYVYMHLCDESKNILNQTPGFCSGESGDFEMISDDEISLKCKEFNRYKWYILRVASNCEEKVRQHILENSMRLGVNDYFKEVFIPYEELSEVELKSKKIATRRKCFPGYVFLYVNLCDEVLNFINNIPKSLKVYGFLKNGNIPKVILDDEIHSMCNALYNAQETKKLGYGYEKGEKVKINDGLFQNFTGKVNMVNDEKKIINVEVSILGKPTIIELDLAQVEKIED